MGVMAIPLPTPWSAQADWSPPVLLGICGAFALAAAGAVFAPPGSGCRWPLSPSIAAGILAFHHVAVVCVAWLLIAGATLEMTLGDLVGPGAFQTTIAAVKGAELVLARCASFATASSPTCSIRPRRSWRCSSSGRRMACTRI